MSSICQQFFCCILSVGLFAARNAIIGLLGQRVRPHQTCQRVIPWMLSRMCLKHTMPFFDPLGVSLLWRAECTYLFTQSAIKCLFIYLVWLCLKPAVPFLALDVFLLWHAKCAYLCTKNTTNSVSGCLTSVCLRHVFEARIAIVWLHRCVYIVPR